MGLLAKARAAWTTRYWVYLIAFAFALGLLAGGKLQRLIDAAAENAALKDAAKATGAQAARTADTHNDARRDAGRAQLQNEDATHGTQERIRTVYRTQYVTGDCRQPDGVRAALDQAIGRANDRVRAGAGLPAAGVPDRRDVPGQ